MVPDRLPSLASPRRRRGAGTPGSRWVPVFLALLLLIAAGWFAWIGPSAALHRLDRALTPDAGASR